MFIKQQQFQQLQSSYLSNNSKPHMNISVLRHLPKPLQILDCDDANLQLPDPVCYYATKLSTLPQRVFPTLHNTKKLSIQQTKLISMQNAQFQFKQVKKMYEISKYRSQHVIPQQQQNAQKSSYAVKVKSLYNLFFSRVPYYCRFQNHLLTKNNFANMFINVAGVNLSTKHRNKAQTPKNLPKILRGQNYYNKGNLMFDSNIESGNLLYVYEVPSEVDNQTTKSYQLILHNDSNTYGHNQWFFFRCQVLKPHTTVKFIVVNLIKSDSLFNYGLKPLVFSQKQNLTKNIGWLRRGQNIRYCQNQIRRQNKKDNYFSLQFEYTFKEARDWVYFCPSYPYTYTQMTSYIQNLYLEPLYRKCFSIKTLSQTLGKNKINLITISTGQRPIQQCKIVWILARQHPAQTTSSYMVEGILKYLLPLIAEAKSLNSKGFQRLHGYVFKIVPMLNVDGVIHGNSRAELVGLDPNRSWKKPRKLISPATWHILKEIMAYKNNVSMVLDLHSHSKKTGCFFYGNQVNHNPRISKIYPTLICQNDERFLLKNCRFRGGYKTTARHVLFQQLKIENIFTVQCSLLGYTNKKTNRVVEYTIQDYHQMGAKLIEGYFKFQNIKLEKNLNQIIDEFSERIQQLCEVDSAKSDSSASDDQYDEIRQLERKLVKKRRSYSLKPSRNQSLTQNTLKDRTNLPSKAKKRSFSFLNDKLIQKSYKVQAKKNIVLMKCSIPNEKIKVRIVTVEQRLKQKPQQSINQLGKYSAKDQNQLIYQNKFRRSYMKYITNSKIYNQSFSQKGKTQEAHRNCSGKDFSSQVCIQTANQNNRKILQNSDSNLPPRIDKKIRTLYVLGSPCQSQFSVYTRNQVSTQVCEKNSNSQTIIQKEKNAIANLPKLMSLITANKMKKFTNGPYKQNQNCRKLGTVGTRYIDTKSLFYQQKNKRCHITNLNTNNV